jgi:hypothetical protein
MKITHSQYKVLKRLLSGIYLPAPRPETHDNASWRTLEKKQLIVDVNGYWKASPLGAQIVAQGGKIRPTEQNEQSEES